MTSRILAGFRWPLLTIRSSPYMPVCIHLHLTRNNSTNPCINMPNYPTYKELTEEIQSPTAISLGLGEEGKPLRARCYNCGQIGHISYDCKYPQVRKACYTCGNQGHLSRDCPQKKKVLVCYACRQVGHITVDCPNRKKNRPLDDSDPL